MNTYEVGDIVSGVVTGIEDYGIFVSIDDEYTGLIHISEVSDAFVRNINDYAEIDEKIKAKIIECDSDNKHLKLTIKNLNYREGDKSRVKIKETVNGFSTLKEELDVWVNDKLEEMK